MKSGFFERGRCSIANFGNQGFVLLGFVVVPSFRFQNFNHEKHERHERIEPSRCVQVKRVSRGSCTLNSDVGKPRDPGIKEKNLRHLRHLRILIPAACFATQGKKKESTDLKDYADEIQIF